MRKSKTAQMAVAIRSIGLSTWMLLTALLVVVGFSTATAVAADSRGETYSFNISAQKLNDALQALAFASQHKLLYSSRLVDGKESPALKGEYTAEEAVAKLLAGTGLVYQVTSDGLVVIREAAAKSTDQQDSEGRLARNLQNCSGFSADKLDSSPSVNRTGSKAKNGCESQKSQENLALARGEETEGMKPVQPNDGESSLNSDLTGSRKIEEIVVTAQKREERLQDVPISIAVLDGKQLDSNTARSVNDALKQVPGVFTFDQSQLGGARIAMRGVASNSSSFNSSNVVGYYLDELPFGFARYPLAPDANTYDLKRVEVLRGPQGTLYGAQSLNGVIRVLTNDASVEENELKTRALLSNTEEGGWNERVDAAGNLVLVPGKLGFRAALSYVDNSGWADQVVTGDKNVNDSKLKSGRFKLGYQATDNLWIQGLVWVSRNDFGGPSVLTKDYLQPDGTKPQPIWKDYDLFNLSANLNLNGFSIASTTSYIDYKNGAVIDIAAGPISFDTAFQEINSRNFTQEVRVASSDDQPVTWLVGGIYRKERDSELSSLPIFFGGVDESIRYGSESYAGYADLTYTFMDGLLALTGGARYYSDRETGYYVSQPGLGGAPLTPILTERYSATTKRLVLTWHPDPDLNVYTSYSEGFRSGFPLAQNVDGFLVPPVRPDRLDNYEIGAKGELIDNLLKFEAAVYYIKWSDTQQNLFREYAPGVLIAGPFNAGDLSGPGVDLAFNGILGGGFSYSMSAGWNDLTFDADITHPTTGAAVFRKGERVDLSPEWTAHSELSYARPVGSQGYSMAFALSGNYVSAIMGSRSVTTGEVQKGDDFLDMGLRWTLNSPTNWTAMLFVDNALNENRTVVPTAPTSLQDGSATVRSRPRTVGVQFEYRFQ